MLGGCCRGRAAVAARWLLPQRDDAGAAIVLAFLFAGAGSRQWRPAARSSLELVAPSSCSDLARRRIRVAARVVSGPCSAPARIAAAPSSVSSLVVVTVLSPATSARRRRASTGSAAASTHGPTDTAPGRAHVRRRARHRVDARDHGDPRSLRREGDVLRSRQGDRRRARRHACAATATASCSATTRTITTAGAGSTRAIPSCSRRRTRSSAAIGTCPVFYRPPHGDRTPFLAHVVHDHDMHMVLWDVSSADWSSNDPQAVAGRTLDEATSRVDHPAARRARREPEQAAARDRAGAAADPRRPAGQAPRTGRLDVLLHTPAYQPCT